MIENPFAKLRPGFVQERLRPDLELRYSMYLGCGGVLTEPADRSYGLHGRCEPGYRVGAKFVRPGDGNGLDASSTIVCGGCGVFFIAPKGNDGGTQFKSAAMGWTTIHAKCRVPK